jgi:hypothetical protein
VARNWYATYGAQAGNGAGRRMTEGQQEELRRLLLEALRVADELGHDLVALYITQAIDTLSPQARR